MSPAARSSPPTHARRRRPGASCPTAPRCCIPPATPCSSRRSAPPQFHAPATGEWGFTCTYTGAKDASGRTSLFTPRAAGGMYVMYHEGHASGRLDEEEPAQAANRVP